MPSSDGNICPLADLQTGESGELFKIKSGLSAASRLSTLGFTPGVKVFMAQNYGHGPLMVMVRDTRVALGRGEARKIWVHKVEV